PTVGSSLGYEAHLRAAAPPLLGIRVGSDNAELLDRIEGHPKDGLERLSALLIVHINAIKRDVCLVGLAAIDRAIAKVGRVALGIHVPNEGDARLKAEQAGDVSSFERQLCDLLGCEGIADCRILLVKLHFSSGYSHGFADRADLKLHAEVSGGIDHQ